MPDLLWIGMLTYLPGLIAKTKSAGRTVPSTLIKGLTDGNRVGPEFYVVQPFKLLANGP